MEDVARQPRKGRIAALIAGEAVAVAVVLYLMIVRDAGWIAVVLLFAVVIVFTGMIMRTGESLARSRGSFSPAMARYNRRMLGASLVYVAGLFLAIWVHDRFEPQGLPAFIVALAPSAGILLMVAAMARLLVEETDEYLRSRYIRSALFGLGTLLTLATVWGFFEQFGLVPHAPGWLAAPVYALGLGIASCWPGERA